ncbi:MAG: hypothetical protein ACLR6B_04915 [Blautia sp.]
MTCLFISHDLALVSNICDRIAVMYDGKIVESGVTDQIIHHSSSDYTKKLLQSVFLADQETMTRYERKKREKQKFFKRLKKHPPLWLPPPFFVCYNDSIVTIILKKEIGDLKKGLFLGAAFACLLGAVSMNADASTLVYGSGDYTRINPAMDEHGEINILIFNGLTAHDGENQVVPALAKSWSLMRSILYLYVPSGRGRQVA